MLLRTCGSGLATNQVSVELEHWSVLGSSWGEEEMGQMFLRIHIFIFRKVWFSKRCKMLFAKCYWLFLGRIESDTGVLKDSSLSWKWKQDWIEIGELLLWLYLVFHSSLKVKVLPSHIWQNNFSWTWKLSRSSEFHSELFLTSRIQLLQEGFELSCPRVNAPD